MSVSVRKVEVRKENKNPTLRMWGMIMMTRITMMIASDEEDEKGEGEVR